MKKLISILLVLSLIFAFASCAKNQEEPISQPQSASTEAAAENTSSGESKILVIYYSWSGNTEAFADYIHDTVGGELVRILPEKAYPEDYNECADTAKEERDNDARPKFKALGVNPEDYDVIFVGYPIWWYTLPMIMYTFFDTYDFSGKTIIPFNTHEGSGDGGTYETIKDFEPNANVLEGLPIRGGKIGSAQSEVKQWLEELQY